MAKERWASLISGGGSTMFEMASAIQSGEIEMEAACVIASTPEAGGLIKAQTLGIPVEVVNPKDYTGADGKVDLYAFGVANLAVLRKYGATVVTQNGYLARTSDIVIDAFRDSIFNQHPGPKRETHGTKGTQPHAIMLYIAQATGRNYGTEVITHRVNSKWDNGMTVGVVPVPIEDINEDPKVLQARALPVEHKLQIVLLQQIVKGEVREVEIARRYTSVREEEILRSARAYARKIYPDG
ncbi:MAG: hypothetical protein A3A58_01660 [Candidatus Blackburnbacteria bacterium RIFCSPLOWO2_01_FULL_41_27]|uniref:phosphoribosylglycinamide formyltransferase 1 n=1 Tax=Candidatus Blackburnbacteria bacterium RIFCSPLOWO2_01_FULL_41_27 TaxID=1797520 RepID=A0A1G1VGV7_9BACT|nr:MAG: hypothetical protein A3A58_01660 [Candidatus Blackburnbacteria bacterium RIFCSPLOWO2_01_FULL_41_27]